MIKQIGSHRVTNASIESPLLDKMLEGVSIDVLYSDPPWGDGNMKYWVTMNKKMTGAEYAPLSYDGLLARVFELAHRYVSKFVFIETGVRWGDAIADRMSAEGLHNIKRFRLQYRSGSKMLDCVLIVGGMTAEYNFPLSGEDDLYPYYGAELSRLVLDYVKPVRTVLDPCCGMGYTARAAVANGAVFYGNEFNERRLGKTVAFLEKSV